MTDPPASDDAVDPLLQEGIDHLQQAAREMISASRSLLDVAEQLVEDPRGLTRLTGLLGTVAHLAQRNAEPRRHPDDDDEPPVQRIPVS